MASGFRLVKFGAMIFFFFLDANNSMGGIEHDVMFVCFDNSDAPGVCCYHWLVVL